MKIMTQHLKSYARSVLILGGSVLLLSNCSMTTPTSVTPNRVQLNQTANSFPLTGEASENASHIAQIATDYLAAGEGFLRVTVPYNQANKSASAQAIQTASLYRQALIKHGVKNVDVNIAPQEKVSKETALISYKSWKTAPPKGCEGSHIPGYYGAGELSTFTGYPVGCDLESLIGRMVAHPKDLLGNVPKKSVGHDSRRETALIENHAAGIPNERLEGLSASEVGSE